MTLAIGNVAASTGAKRRRTVLICVLLFLVAFAWRAVHLPRLQLLHVDETRFSLPTAREIAAGHLHFFIRGTNYGAPIQEAAAALLFRVFGESPVTLRLPVVFFSSLAVVGGFLALRRVEDELVALGLAVLLACPASAVTRYGVGAHPVYAFLGLVFLALQAGAWRLDRSRTVGAWIAWSLLAGFSMYVLKIAAVPIAIALLWLGLRSQAFRSWRRELVRDPDMQRAWRRIGVLCGLSVLVIAPVLYRALTRRATYVPRTYELCLMLLAGSMAAIAVALIFARGRVPWRRMWPIGAVILATILFTVPPAIYFRCVEAPRLAAEGIKQWPEKQYHLKHAHEWPMQARLFLDRIIPALVIGRSNQLEGEPPEQVPLTWKAGFSLALLGLLSFGGIGRLRAAGLARMLYSRAFVMIAPPILFAAVMFPSWVLHSDTCFRYAVPFLAGICLLAWKCVEPAARPHWRVAITGLAAYVAYCAFDCWKNLS
jgi:hypothetical protein